MTINAVEPNIDTVVRQYLELLDTWSGYLLHVGTMLTTEILETATVNMEGPLALNGLISSTAVYETLNKAYKYILQPNISGITIYAESEKCNRGADVSERMVLSVAEGGTDENNQVHQDNFSTTKQYTVDNNVPKLRTWTIKGYIMATEPLDTHLLVKPSLMTKALLLDSMMISRLPVLLKTHDCRFYKVLIQDFEYEYDPKSNNSVTVDITLKEFKTMSVLGDNKRRSIIGTRREEAAA